MDDDINIIKSIILSIVWTGIAIIFGFGVRIFSNHIASEEFFAGYILERFLSFDNIFIFILIFRKFQISRLLKEKLLMYGIILAIILRGIFIIIGAELVIHFHWILYIFGIFLIYSGIKIIFAKDDTENINIEDNRVIKFVQKFFPTLANSTTLIIVITIAVCDIIFAIDSIPAVFSVTRDMFVILSANVFSLLGLQSIFFLMSDIIDRFHYLEMAMSIILIFIGIKMLIEHFFIISTLQSIIIIISIILIAIMASILRKKPV